jgi:hypothetical protein
MTDADDVRRWLEELVEELSRRLREGEEEVDGGGDVEDETLH